MKPLKIGTWVRMKPGVCTISFRRGLFGPTVGAGWGDVRFMDHTHQTVDVCDHEISIIRNVSAAKKKYAALRKKYLKAAV